MSRNKQLILNIGIIILILTIASFFILFRLGASILQDWDEAIYAQVAREMVSSKDWLTPHYNFQPWFEKPPLLMWITATFYSVFGINEFWSRAASAFSGILLVLVTYLTGKKAFNIRVGVLSAFVLLSSYDFLWQSRNGTTDMMLSLFIYLSLLAYIYARKDQRYWYGIGIFFSLAFMTKFWASGIIPITLLIALIIERRLIEVFRSRHFWGSALLSLVLILPWHISMLVLHFKPFIERYLIFDLFKRTTSGLEGNVGTPLYYFDWIVSIFSPWFILVPIALLNNFREAIRKKQSVYPQILLILAVVLFCFYSFIVQTKLVWYIVPIYPALCLLIGGAIIQAFDSFRSFAFVGLITSVFIAGLASLSHRPKLSAAVLLLFVIFGIWTFYIYRRDKILAFLKTHISKWNALALMENIKQIEARLYDNMSLPLLFFRMVVFLVAAFFVGSSFAKAFQRSWPGSLYKPTSMSVAEISRNAGQMNPGEPLICLLNSDTNDVDGPSILFYSDRPQLIARSLAELDYFVEHDNVHKIIFVQQDQEALSTTYDLNIQDEVPPLIYATINKK